MMTYSRPALSRVETLNQRNLLWDDCLPVGRRAPDSFPDQASVRGGAKKLAVLTEPSTPTGIEDFIHGLDRLRAPAPEPLICHLRAGVSICLEDGVLGRTREPGCPAGLLRTIFMLLWAS
jgi:hypothetical protein